MSESSVMVKDVISPIQPSIKKSSTTDIMFYVAYAMSIIPVLIIYLIILAKEKRKNTDDKIEDSFYNWKIVFYICSMIYIYLVMTIGTAVYKV